MKKRKTRTIAVVCGPPAARQRLAVETLAENQQFTSDLSHMHLLDAHMLVQVAERQEERVESQELGSGSILSCCVCACQMARIRSGIV